MIKVAIALTAAVALSACTTETKCRNIQTGAEGIALFGICVGGSCPDNPAPIEVRIADANGYASDVAYDPKVWRCGGKHD
jgi:hypothetical protein